MPLKQTLDFKKPVSLVNAPQSPQITLAPFTAQAAQHLGPLASAIDPWKRYQVSADNMTALLAKTEAGAPHYSISANGQHIGGICIRLNWLRGPFLQTLFVLPDAQGQGIGTQILKWFEAAAADEGARQAWITVSSFNESARRFYDRQGYETLATLPDLIADGFDELLLRKKLSARKPPRR